MENSVEKALTHLLNIHGFSFQYAVLNVADEYFSNGESPWCFEVAEFPVEVNGISLHIDFILRNEHEPFFLVAECKRVDPALANWCFIKAPFVSRKIRSSERIVREVISGRHEDLAKGKTSLQWIERSENVYRLAFEVKSDKKGEGKWGRGQINDATSQVLRGLNGLISFAFDDLRNGSGSIFQTNGREPSSICFMPVIFTTAKLWVSDTNMREADLRSGDIDINNVKLREIDWLFYHYAQSPSLKHSLPIFQQSENLSDSLYYEYTRTIAVVSASGISSFLSYNYWKEPGDWKEG